MTHKIALAYARWLTTPLGQSQVPPILYIFIFCPLAMFGVLGCCGPYYAAYFHGTLLDGTAPPLDYHRRMDFSRCDPAAPERGRLSDRLAGPRSVG